MMSFTTAGFCYTTRSLFARARAVQSGRILGDFTEQDCQRSHGRLLIVHGTYDDNVHPQNAWHFIDELIHEGMLRL
jgi:hypothetical protein